MKRSVYFELFLGGTRGSSSAPSIHWRSCHSVIVNFFLRGFVTCVGVVLYLKHGIIVKMSSETDVNYSETENACVVCFKNVDIYSVGICDHPVCYECSTRMRVLCKQNECPICRQDMPKVIFTREVDLFNNLKPKAERMNFQEKKIGIFFSSGSIQRAYYRLLEHNCKICDGRGRRWPFRTFQELKDHMRREHELFYCDLCVANLKIFTFERRCYTRSELALHRRKGDADNTSHRGHPLCEFCDVRYVDNDELFRHLRREHLFCHFCDADGKHQYYNAYADLRKHFIEDHYVCEEGECKNEQFTSVFRTDIDLRAHIANVHSRHMSKSATKQARTLELEFRFRGRRQQGHNGDDDLEGAVGYENYNMEPGGNYNDNSNAKPFNSTNSADFPTLGNATEVPATRATSSVTFTKITSKPFSAEDFPSLGSRTGTGRSSNVTITASGKIGGGKGFASGKAPEVTIQATRRPQNLKINQQNFPALGGGSTSNSTVRFSISNNNQERPQSSRPNLSIHVSNQANVAITTRITTAPTSTMQPRPKSSEAFPALSSAPIPEAQWVPQKAKKQQEPAKMAKVSPAPQLPPSSLDFPALSKSGKNDPKVKKRSTVTMPVSNSWVNLNNFNSENSAKNARVVERTSSADKTAKVSDKHSDSSKPKKKKQHKGIDKIIADNADENKNKIDNGECKNYYENPINRNGIVKKISQLQIDAFVQSKENGLAEEFPTLGNKKPPPGFNVKPPPGFDNCNAILPSNDLTFTNSSGQSYSILPTQSYDYHLPPNFETRNKKLIDNFMNVVDSGDAIREFKIYSDLFRNGSYSAQNYYEHCRNFLGDDFDRIFPELLVLLPDIGKQQELYRIHTSEGARKDLEVCKTCNQVVLLRDLRSHLSNHTLENNFPILERPAEPLSNYWKK